MDISRVGIYGGSAGGQNAMGALLFHNDFYSVAAADCGCHDNRMDKLWWNEAWMGYPVDQSYEESSNVVNAWRLEGSLLLSVGELDTNVDPASTMQVVHALHNAGKDYDLLFVPGWGHGVATTNSYAQRRTNEFLYRKLKKIEPPQ
jgi:dipeptidyl-peptidase-4